MQVWAVSVNAAAEAAQQACPRAVTQRQAPHLAWGTPGREDAPNASTPPPSAPRIAIVLAPFTRSTHPGIAAALLLHYTRYHVQLGAAKVVQYTQARAPVSIAAVA